jgi:hypothetical protein
MMNYLLCASIVGVGATAVTDIWALIRERLLGIAAPNFALVGRWLALMLRGRFRHESIAAAPSVRHERLIGWTAHYLIGIVFAGLLLVVYGITWIDRPTIVPALLIGVGTVAAPFLLILRRWTVWRRVDCEALVCVSVSGPRSPARQFPADPSMPAQDRCDRDQQAFARWITRSPGSGKVAAELSCRAWCHPVQ